MIDLDADNYQYASDRVRAIESIALSAFADNGLLLEFAPNNFKSDFTISKPKPFPCCSATSLLNCLKAAISLMFFSDIPMPKSLNDRTKLLSIL